MRLLAALAAIIVMTLAGCIAPTSDSSGFLDVEITPLGDSSGLIYLEGESETRDLFVTIENEMRLPVTDVRIEAANYNPGVIELQALEAQPIERIAGFENPQGEPFLEYLEVPVTLNAQKRTYTADIEYHACAQAGTLAHATVCLAPNRQPGSYDPSCAAGTVELDENQRAPVRVTDVRIVDSISRVALYVDVINEGPGTVFAYNSTSECSYIDQSQMGIIRLESVTLSGVVLACQDREQRMGFAREHQVRSGATFTCLVDKDNPSLADVFDTESTFETTLEIELSYGYHVNAGGQTIILKSTP